MPRRSKARGVYCRGPYWLDFDRRSDGTLRTPNFCIFWYDPGAGRNRSISARTADEQEARRALDRHYLQNTEGQIICPTCGQRRTDRETSYFVADAIADYLAQKNDRTLEHRLGHVVDYLATLSSPGVRCRQIDDDWVKRFREWLLKQPVVLSSGALRPEPRSLSTVENSVLQLAAAINAAHKRGDISRPAQFKVRPGHEVNHTPKRRLSVGELAAAFRYATDPRFPKKRKMLHRFLMLAVGTAARPDAVYDFSTDPARAQWDADRSVLTLNPKGRAQTRKYRAIVKVPYQLVAHINETSGFFVPTQSVRSAWDSMCDELGWPKDREAGTKLIRRSMAQLLRDPMRGVPTEQLELQLGHRRIASTTDIYASHDPAYLAAATRAIEAVIDEIEALAPGAFHRSDTGEKPNVVPIGAAKSSLSH